MLSHYAAQRERSSLKYIRGVKLANHITRILEFCGATVDDSKEGTSGTGTESRNEEFMMVNHEECEPEAAIPVSSEPQDSQSPQQRINAGTPVDPLHYYVVNEKESGKDLLGHKYNAGQKKPRVDGGLDARFERQIGSGSEASGESSEKMYVMCAPCSEDMARETQSPYSCVSERLDRPEKDNTERPSDEVKKEPSSESTQDTSHEQQDKTPPEVVEFVITDSMKGIQNTLWVYQYFGVVDAKTGNPWTGSVEEYCR